MILTDGEQKLAELVALARVQSRGGFVEAQQGRLGTHRARDLEPSLIAISQVAGCVVCATDQSNFVEPVPGAVDRCSLGATKARCTEQPEQRVAGCAHQRVVLSHHQIFEHGHAGKQTNILKGAGNLRDLGDAVIKQPLQQKFLRSSCTRRIMPVVGL